MQTTDPQNPGGLPDYQPSSGGAMGQPAMAPSLGGAESAPGRTAARPDQKSPALAAMLSAFPGVGQLYNGELAKGVAFVSAFATCIYLADRSDGTPFFVFCLPFIFFYNLIDAYQSAQRINLMALSGALPPQSSPEASPQWGWSLIGMGSLLLLNNLGLFRFEWVAKLWPLVLVGVGVVLLRGSLWGRR